MPLTSDLSLNLPKFAKSSISPETHKFNEQLISIGEKGPLWWEVGAAEYRRLRWEGLTPLPKPRVIETGADTAVPSRDANREIPVRVFKPESGGSRGVFMHIHGGGWVLQSEHFQDPLLKYVADNTNLTVVSIGYRLAPEHPFPAGPDDCYDAADYLVTQGAEKFGGELKFIGGESAGGHLSVMTALHISSAHPQYASLQGLILHYGAYDLSTFLPSVHLYAKRLVLTADAMAHFIDAFLPNTTAEQRRDPTISPFYAALDKANLPPALFTVGTEDCLLDDTICMASRWLMAGKEAVVKVYEGAPHGFTLFPPETGGNTLKGFEDMKAFILEKLR